MTQKLDQQIAALIEAQPANHALQQAFYCEAAIYERDLERVFMRQWLYVGHESEIRKPGDYLLFEVGYESVIVIRDDQGEVRGLVNVCRHRGSRVCDRERGSARNLVCPYHGWTYDRSGQLIGARFLPDDVDKTKLSLKRVHVRIYHGLIYVSFAENPPDIDTAFRELDEAIRPFDLARTKVAHRALYSIDANWKLAVENYDECYHCQPAHREFAYSHGRADPHATIESHYAAMNEKARDVGLVYVNAYRSGISSIAGTEQFFMERYPLYHGYETGSEDGKPLAPLLGSLKGYDGGATDLQIGPVSFGLIYSDHAVIYRFSPRAQFKTDCEITWLVRESAQAGIDYDLEKLCWLWDVTTIADKDIITRNQAGIRSRYYEPGPYVLTMESHTRGFTEWYMNAIR